MKIHHNLEDYSVERAILTQGTFDGVHLGHKKIISRVIEMANANNGESVLLTFHPHPRHVLFPEQDGPRMLSTLKEKISRLETIGLDHLIIFPFTKEFSRMPAIQFVRDLLVNDIKAKKIVVGYDHHFARNREGNLDTLNELASLYDFKVEEISAQEINNVNISSTKIRSAIIEGDLETANKYLGYDYSIEGKVVEGKKIGRTLGFPTANIQLQDELKLIPKDGIYAVRIDLRSEIYEGMMSIGLNPTIDGSNVKRYLEVNIFDFNEDIYGQELKVNFFSRLRDEVKFEDMNALKQKMKADKLHTLEILKRL